MIGLDSNQEINRVLTGIIEILERIKNEELTHGDARAFARVTIRYYKELALEKPELYFWLTALSMTKIPLYDRAYCANEAIKLLHKERRKEGEQSEF